MSINSKREFEVAAHHESGHIVISYLSRFTCDSVHLKTSDPGTASTRMNYGGDELLVASIFNYIEDPAMFNGLDRAFKERSPNVARALATILLAGPAAESLFKNKLGSDGKLSIEISGPDLVRVENVDYFLTQIDPHHDSVFIQSTLETVSTMMKISQVWRGVKAISEALLARPDYKLSKPGIEESLRISGYLSYVDSLYVT